MRWFILKSKHVSHRFSLNVLSRNWASRVSSSRPHYRCLTWFSIYAASKYALEGVSETMAATLKPWNIAVSLVEPGPVSTDLDYLSPYGTKLIQSEDPYYSIFEGAGLLDPDSPTAQTPQEIAFLIKDIIEEEKPHFRYQTTEPIQEQAGKRLVDTTGDSSVAEWHQLLFSE